MTYWPIRSSLRDSPNFEITEETGTCNRVKIEIFRRNFWVKLSGEIQISQKIPFGSMNISCSQATQDPTLYRHVFDYDNGIADVTKCSSKFV